MKVSSVSQMRSLDKRAIHDFGIKAELLMENAGHAAYSVLRQAFGISGKHFFVFCGIGNNGGDGCVLARKIHADGGSVKVCVLGDPGRFKGAARLNYKIVTRLPVEVQRIESTKAVQEEIEGCGLIVDAIFGTGLSRDLEGQYRDTVELINASAKPVLSIDIPSGVHGDTGQIMGAAIKADYTVTFGLPKYGNLLYPGCALGGKLFVSHISFPPSLYTADSLKVEINAPLRFPKAETINIDGQRLRVGDTAIDLLAPRPFPGKFGRHDLLIVDLDEFSGIAGKSAQEVEVHPVDVLQQTAGRINAIIVLKGPRTLIGFPDQRVNINLSGPLGVETKEYWSALDGLITAMSKLGLPLQQAVRHGVFLHGLAGDFALEEHRQRDVKMKVFLKALPQALEMLQEDLDMELERRYTGAQIV